VSVRSMEQEGMGDAARIIFITHEAKEIDMTRCLKELGKLPAVKRVVSSLRVIPDE
jgi:homoserine dehydrogenase